MSAQHTPGPWVAKESPESEHFFWIVTGPRLHIGVSTDRSKADACLIAAAPELLSALQYVVARLGGGSITSLDVDHAISAARAAIAKTEGQS